MNYHAGLRFARQAIQPEHETPSASALPMQFVSLAQAGEYDGRCHYHCAYYNIPSHFDPSI